MLPEQVRKQVEQADEIAKQLNLVPTEPVEIEPAEPAGVADTPVEPAAEPVASGTPAPVQGELDLEDAWESKYKVLQGKYNAEVPRLQQQLREMQTHVERMQGAMAALQRQPAAQSAPQAAAPAAGPVQLIKPEEVEEYGADLISLMERAALQRVTPKMQEMQGTIDRLVGQLSSQVGSVAQRQYKTDEDRFFAAVDEKLPTWREINVRPEWLQYLAEPDPMTGITRQTYLDDARRSLDAGRVVNIFKAFTGNTTVSEPDEKTNAPKPSDALTRHVQPSRTRATSAAAPASAGPVTRGDITKLYDDYRKGMYRGKEAEFKRREIELLDAINNGRLQ